LECENGKIAQKNGKKDDSIKKSFSTEIACSAEVRG